MTSQYFESYLNGNGKAEEGKGLTVGTFIKYNVRGSAYRRWSDKYEEALLRAIRQAIKQGLVVCGRSAGGRTAFYRK